MLKQLKKEPCLVVLSGGLDSTTVLYSAMKRYESILAISYMYGQRHSIELEFAKETTSQLSIEHKVIDLTSISDSLKDTCSLIGDSNIDVPNIEDILGDPQPSTYVPFRNMLMFTISASIAEGYGAGAIYTGIQAQDLYSYWDTSAVFVERLNTVFGLNRKHPIMVVAPFVRLTKHEIIKIGLDLGVDYSKTSTCYNPDKNGIACGVCGSCAERIQAFIKNGIPDPIKYQIELDWDNMFLQN